MQAIHSADQAIHVLVEIATNIDSVPRYTAARCRSLRHAGRDKAADYRIIFSIGFYIFNCLISFLIHLI